MPSEANTISILRPKKRSAAPSDRSSFFLGLRFLFLVAMFERGGNETVEQRMGLGWAALEFGVGLARHEPRMVRQLDHLGETAIGRDARNHHAGLLELAAILVVHLVTMAMALIDDLFAIDIERLGALFELARIRAQTHRYLSGRA